MFIVLINGQDASSHTIQVDAVDQKARFEALSMGTITIEEKDTFNPPQE